MKNAQHKKEPPAEGDGKRQVRKMEPANSGLEIKTAPQNNGAGNHILAPVKPMRASDQIYEQIRDLIFRGELKPGQKVMSERQMAEAFNVSRPTVREAIHRLTDRGLIENRRGVGAFVGHALDETGSPSLLHILGGKDVNPVDLTEVRMTLECSGVRYAAERATQQDLSRLEKNIEVMRRQYETGQYDKDEDLIFHMNIAFATHNLVHIHLMRSFHDLLHILMSRFFETWYAIPGYDKLALDQHIRILKSIRHRDPDEAETAMREQIQILLDLVRQPSNL
ncbi:MAG: FadR family transcriptional regulator [Deltaproteobacteria bacterium]|nr:FadR family transcriptional regulator [Deltaproteobacteria bacterium]